MMLAISKTTSHSSRVPWNEKKIKIDPEKMERIDQKISCVGVIINVTIITAAEAC